MLFFWWQMFYEQRPVFFLVAFFVLIKKDRSVLVAFSVPIKKDQFVFSGIICSYKESPVRIHCSMYILRRSGCYNCYFFVTKTSLFFFCFYKERPGYFIDYYSPLLHYVLNIYSKSSLSLHT